MDCIHYLLDEGFQKPRAAINAKARSGREVSANAEGMVKK